MDFFEQFKSIEEQDRLETVTAGDDQLWPIIRTKVFEEYRKISGLRSRVVNVSAKTFNVFCKTFFYGFGNLLKLKNADCWVFSASDRRKELNGQYHDRIIEDVFELIPKTILIENPLPLGYHYKRHQVPHKEVVGQTFLYFWLFLFSRFISIPKINNEDVLTGVLEKLSVHVDYKRMYALYKGQYILAKFLLRFCRPQKVIMVYTASSQGYIRAFKEKGIPVIEFQHGVINQKHIVYNVFKRFNSIYYPDYLFTFSDCEKSIFHSGNYFVRPDSVKSVGYSFLEKVIQNTTPPTFSKNSFKKVIAFSFQEPFADFSVNFLKEIALKAKDVLFLLVLRNPNSWMADGFPPNLIVDPAINIYKALKLCDIHATINSSTTIEALAFGKPSILIDYQGQANAYFHDLASHQEVHIVSSVDDFIKASEALIKADTNSIKLLGSKFFKPNFRKNLITELSQLQG